MDPRFGVGHYSDAPMRLYFCILAAGSATVLGIDTASAIPPPDFLFAVGSQVGIVFSVMVVFLSTVLGGSLALARSFFALVKHKRVFWSVAAIAVLALSIGGGVLFDALWQEREYREWLKDSERFSDEQGAAIDMTKLDVSTQSGSASTNETSSDAASSEPVSELTARPPIAVDAGIAFIERYYENLGNGNAEAAYDVSKKSVPLATFKEWYAGTTGTEIESIQKIRDGVYSLVARIDEGSVSTRYAVLITLAEDPVRGTLIADSDVKVLGETANAPTDQPLPEGATANTSYFDGHQGEPLVIDNDEFASLLESGDPYVLDAREDEEYENGNLPGSHHLRFADLVAGEWISLPADRSIYVLCWSGIRGKEVAEFLRSKGIVARYLKGGSDGWVTYGGAWDGNIKFAQRYPDQRYQLVFSTKQVREYAENGVVFVDARPAAAYERWHIPGSVNMPIIYTPTVEMEATLDQIPPSSTVVTVCDDFVSCFVAKIAGLKLERRGHTFLGRYNKPWEYRDTY